MIKFGPAGNPEDFYNKGYKKSEEMPKYLDGLGLDAYEYQCSRGVNISIEKAKKLGEEASKYEISLSVHSPYYISLSTQEESKKEATIKYIIDTMKVAKEMGADRVVVHAGALLGLDRAYAVESSCKLLKRARDVSIQEGLGNIHICPREESKSSS